MPLRSLEQNKVLESLNRLRNQLGRKSFTVTGSRVYHPIKSVQGAWMPNMFNTFPKA